MSTSHNAFTAAHYSPRSEDYVTSRDHSTGADLDDIEAELKDAGSWKVLDLGCGGGHVSYRAAPHVREVVACDVTQAMLDTVTREANTRGLANVVVKRASAEALPFDAGVFDAVLCRFTTHHWSDMEAGLREASRVLKSGGLAIFVDVVAPADRTLDTHLQTVELLRDASHVRNYSVAEWLAGLSRSGFAIQRLSTRRMRMDFPVWVARTRTSDDHARAIRSLQLNAPEMVKDHLRIGADGGFDLEAVTFNANKP